MKTNSIKHNVVKIYTEDSQTYKATVKVRLNDECHNGHQDFAVTVDVYRKEKNGNFYEDSFGCQHDLALKLCPELKPFIDLHLCDYLGAPMYPSANGYYWLKESRVKPEKLTYAIEYVRATAQEWEILKTSEDEAIYKYHLENLGIVARWKSEAETAIKLLEQLTGNEFVNDSTRSQYTPLTEKEKTAIQEKIKNGYYSTDKIVKRENASIEAKRKKISEDLESTLKATVWKAEKEYRVMKAAHEFGLPIDNLIYYDHSSEAVFNWNNSEYNSKISEQQFNSFMDSGESSLSFGVTWKLGKEKK